MDESKDISKGSGFNPHDPSMGTIAMLQREITGLKELVFVRIEALDKAQKKFEDDVQRVPTDVQKGVGALKEITFEKMSAMEKLRDEKISDLNQKIVVSEATRVEQKNDMAVQFNASLAAFKELVAQHNVGLNQAVNKSEMAMTKQMDQMTNMVKTTAENLQRTIDDLKERILRSEGSGSGKKDMWGFILGGIGLLATIMTILFTVLRNYRG